MEKITFKINMLVSSFEKVGESYMTVNCKKKFVTHTYDDLQNLIMTLVEASDDKLQLEIEKEETDE